ncbi:MAG TPA: hypothetical protein VLV86_26320 [Vicinamibacterales bacterium]|nr:hypothetical protein [Vicinamibacterales bacterium]
MRWHVCACVIVASVLAATGQAHAGALTLTAQAGLGGLGRAGRWAPVRVVVDNTDRDIRGDVVISWGDAVVRRAVTLGNPARAEMVAYIRSADVRDTVSVQLESNGVTLRSTEAPIRLEPPGSDVTVCVTSLESAAATDGCNTSVTAGALPHFLWGYDAVDQVRWQGASPDMLDGDQRIAFDQWTAARRLDDANVVRIAPQPVTDASAGERSLTVVGAVISGYIALIVAAAMSARLRRRPLVVYGVVVLSAALGSVAITAAGRVGPAAGIVVSHSSTVVQLPGGHSVVSMKALAEYPTFDAFALRVKLPGAAVEREGSPRRDMQFDESGEPMLPGVFGLAARQRFALDGVIEFAPFRVVRQNSALTIANASKVDYRDCYFSDGLSRQSVGTLSPGQTIEASSPIGPTTFVSCTLAATPVEFGEPRYRVDVEGTTDVVAYLDVFSDAGAR